ncbi:MAG: nitrilase-related carbon-nitrogen hydrolase [bacterium]|nr:nitrilase-related carbon-nitrogen hydrolase [bacterium]
MKSRLNLFFEKYWFFLPFFSALLLILSFHPFDFWFLGFVALVPLFYFLNFSEKISLSKIFWGGFIVGVIFSSFLSFFTLFHFHWLPETYLFVWLVRLSPLLISLISGVIVGLVLLGYKRLASNKIIDIFVLASLSVLIEIIHYKIFSGFDNGLLAYTAHNLTYLIRLSSLVGIFGISFIITLVNVFIVFFILRPDYRKKIAYLFFAGLTIFFLISFSNNHYLDGGSNDYHSAKFAIIQNSDKKNIFGFFSSKNNHFYFPGAERLIAQVMPSEPNFLIYPFSPFNGHLAIDKTEIKDEGLKKTIAGEAKDFGEWVAKQIDSKTIFVNWVNVVRDDNLYPEIIFLKGKDFIANYQKRELFPAMDYTPEVFKKIGLFVTSVDASPASTGNSPVVEIGDVKFGPLVCSEIFKSELGRKSAFQSNIFLSIGSEAMFVGKTPGEWSLIVSQFIAAANNRPLVRANIFGASAFINEKGKVIEKMDFEKTGVLIKDMKYKKSPKNTLYSYFGDWPFILLILLFLSSITIPKLFKLKKR